MGNNCANQCCQAELSRSINNLRIQDIEDLTANAHQLAQDQRVSMEKNKAVTAKKSLDFQSSNSRNKNEISIQHRESLSRKSSPFETYSDKNSSRKIKSKSSYKSSSKNVKQNEEKSLKENSGLVMKNSGCNEFDKGNFSKLSKMEKEHKESHSGEKEDIR